jgi:hypothetical protein
MEVSLWCNGMTPSSKEIRISYYGAGKKEQELSLPKVRPFYRFKIGPFPDLDGLPPARYYQGNALIIRKERGKNKIRIGNDLKLPERSFPI